MTPLALKFIESHPGEAAAILERADFSETCGLVSALTPELAAGLVARLLPDTAAECLRALPARSAAALVRRLPIDSAAALIGRLDPDQRKRLIDQLPAAHAVPLRLMLRRRPETVGAIADPEALTVRSDMHAGEVMRLARKTPSRLRKYLYVLDERQCLIGTVDTRACLLATNQTPISALMQTDLVTLRARISLTEALQHAGWTRFELLPVVGRGNRFLGVVRRATLIQSRGQDANRGGDAGFGETMLNLADLYWQGSAALLAPTGRRAGESQPPTDD